MLNSDFINDAWLSKVHERIKPYEEKIDNEILEDYGDGNQEIYKNGLTISKELTKSIFKDLSTLELGTLLADYDNNGLFAEVTTTSGSNEAIVVKVLRKIVSPLGGKYTDQHYPINTEMLNNVIKGINAAIYSSNNDIKEEPNVILTMYNYDNIMKLDVATYTKLENLLYAAGWNIKKENDEYILYKR